VNAGYTGRPGLWQVVLLNGAITDSQVEYGGAEAKAAENGEVSYSVVWNRMLVVEQKVDEILKGTEKLIAKHRIAIGLLITALNYIPQDEEFYNTIQNFLMGGE
jgi:broad specificity phosphatase PhoE